MADISEADWRAIIDTLIAEGGGQGEESMRRIGETIINRGAVRGLSFGDVVRQPAQYTGYSAPGPAAVEAQRDANMRAMAQRAWETALIPGDPTGGADHYYNPRIVDPGWQRSMRHTGDFGGHAYYSSRPIPPNDLANAVASMLDVAPETRNVPFPRNRPQFRDVPFPRPRPSSPGDQTRALFDHSFSAPQDQRTAAGLDAFIARNQQAQTRPASMVLGDGIAQSHQRSAASSSPDLAAALQAFIRPKAPPMPTGVAQSYAGQERGTSQSTQRSIADMFDTTFQRAAAATTQVSAPASPRMTTAQVRADNGQNRTSSTSGVGKPPATRVVQSVPVPPRPAAPSPRATEQRMAAQIAAQERADRAQTASAPRTTAPVPRTTPSAQATQQRNDAQMAAQERADRVQPRTPSTGAGGQIANMFGNQQVPHASSSVNNEKDQTRLTNTAVIDRRDNDALLLAHGLIEETPRVVANVRMPTPVSQRPAQQPTRVAVTQQPAPRAVTGMPTPVSQRPVSVAPAMAYTAPRATPSAAARAAANVATGGQNGGGGGSSGGSGGSGSSGSGGGSFAGVSSGRSYDIGGRYTMGGDVYRANANGSFTNERTGQTLVGSSRR